METRRTQERRETHHCYASNSRKSTTSPEAPSQSAVPQRQSSTLHSQEPRGTCSRTRGRVQASQWGRFRLLAVVSSDPFYVLLRVIRCALASRSIDDTLSASCGSHWA